MICIPRSEANKIKEAIKNGDFTIAKLYEMNSQDRHDLFSVYVGDKLATFVNGNFEKAMVSRQKDSLKQWVKDTFGKQKEEAKDAIDKIENLEEVLRPGEGEDFLRDLAAIKLGFQVTEKQAKTIVEKTEKLAELQGEVTDLGLPTDKFLEAYNDLEKYVQALNPTNQLRVMTSLFGRAMMLFRPSSVILNIEGNTLNAVLTEIEKRVGLAVTEGALKGDNTDLAKEFVKKNTAIYIKTGYDFTRMNELSEGHRILNEDITHTEGKGFIRKVFGKNAERFLRFTQGVPDVVFASTQFATTANIMSTSIAKDEGLSGDAQKERAREIMKDSFKMEPETDAGKLVREQAQADAQQSTYTGNSFAAKNISLKIRSLFNDLVPNLRLGDLNIPFAKTPANIGAQGIEMAGGGLFEVGYQAYQLKKAWQDVGKGSPEAKQALSRIIRLGVKMGLGQLIAMLITANIDEDDFIGAYPTSPTEQKLFEARRGIENSIRIGDKWVSTAYFGPLAPIITGHLYAKKYKKEGILGSVLGYLRGAGQGILELPGFSQAKDALVYINDIFQEGKSASDIRKDATAGILDFVRARTIPGVVADIAKMTDEYDRKTKGEGELARVKASIPGLRQTLPVKQDVFGNKIETEAAISTLLFGSRAKEAKNNTLLNEMVRLQQQGQLPALSDIEASSTRVKQFKEQVPKAKYNKAVTESRTEFASKTTELIKTTKYKNMTDEQKKAAINKIKDETLDEVLKKYGYKAPKKKKN